MPETNKQALLFNFGEDLSYFVILRYKLRDFIKIYDAYANNPIKEDFQKTLLLFHIGIYFIYLFKILRTMHSRTPYKRGAEVKRIHVYKIYLQKLSRNKRNLNKSTTSNMKCK